MKVGFTGTQEGMTVQQKRQVRRLLLDATEFHHGDCIGADAQAHLIADRLKIPIVQHPPSNSKKRAFSSGGVVLTPQPYLVRNRVIVDSTSKLIAAPNGPERLRSGTWATVRYARRQGKSVLIVRPDGEV